MNDLKNIKLDLIIIGAGIMGLWLLNKLSQLGYQVALLENKSIGGVQTMASQGIIHGGTKYALTGHLSDAAAGISQMTNVWAECVKGTGEIDLSQVKILSNKHYLWTRGLFTAGLKSFISSKLLASDSQVLKFKDYPEVFKNKLFSGSLCECEETVFDVPSLIKILSEKYRNNILWAEDERTQYLWSENKKNLEGIKINNIKLQASQYIFTAGEGTEDLLKNLESPENLEKIKMQKRPLHMVYLKSEKILPEIYAHCVDAGTKPRITITTHYADDGKMVWYLGGELAESGVNKNQKEQIDFAKLELEKLLPWVDLSCAEFSSFYINRAEVWSENKARPDGPFVKKINNFQIVWPTKLTFAPQAANLVLENLEKPQGLAISDFSGIKKAPLLAALWNE